MLAANMDCILPTQHHVDQRWGCSKAQVQAKCNKGLIPQHQQKHARYSSSSLVGMQLQHESILVVAPLQLQLVVEEAAAAAAAACCIAGPQDADPAEV